MKKGLSLLQRGERFQRRSLPNDTGGKRKQEKGKNHEGKARANRKSGRIMKGGARL